MGASDPELEQEHITLLHAAVSFNQNQLLPKACASVWDS